MSSRHTTPDIYQRHGSEVSSETQSSREGLVRIPNRHEIRVYYSPNVKYSYMHEDALRELQRGNLQTSRDYILQIRDLRGQPFYISKYPDGPFYTSRRVIDQLHLKLGGDQDIYLEQIFVVGSPIGVGYQSTYGQHVNKWIVIGLEDMQNNEIRLDMKNQKITMIGLLEDTKIIRPRRELPIEGEDNDIHSIIQSIEKELKKQKR